MGSFNDFITNITDYYDNIAKGKVQNFLPTDKKTPYAGEDLQSRIKQNPHGVNPVIVAGLELVDSYRRSHVMRSYSPKDLFALTKNEALSRKEQYSKLTSSINKVQGES